MDLREVKDREAVAPQEDHSRQEDILMHLVDNKDLQVREVMVLLLATLALVEEVTF